MTEGQFARSITLSDGDDHALPSRSDTPVVIIGPSQWPVSVYRYRPRLTDWSAEVLAASHASCGARRGFTTPPLRSPLDPGQNPSVLRQGVSWRRPTRRGSTWFYHASAPLSARSWPEPQRPASGRQLAASHASWLDVVLPRLRSALRSILARLPASCVRTSVGGVPRVVGGAQLAGRTSGVRGDPRTPPRCGRLRARGRSTGAASARPSTNPRPPATRRARGQPPGGRPPWECRRGRR